MKNFFILVLSIVIVGMASGQDIASFSPAKPTVGSTLTVTYRPDQKKAALQSPQDLSAQLLAFRGEGLPTMIEVVMKKSGSVYAGSTTVGDGVVIYYAQFADGDKMDNNEDRLWTVMVHGENGSPLAGAHMSRGQAYQFGRAANLKFERDQNKAIADLQEEVRLYPNVVSARVMLWSLLLRATPGEETKEDVKRELEEVYVRVKDEEKNVLPLLRVMDMTGQTERTKTLRAEWTAKNPKGVIAESDRWQQAFLERDPKKRFELFQKANADFPAKESDRQGRNSQEINLAIQTGEIEKAVALLQAMPSPSPDLYNSLAWRFIEKGERLEEATGWARAGVEQARRKEDSDKPSYFTKKAWDSMWSTRLGMILDTYGFGLKQLGRHPEALDAYAEAYKHLKGGDADVNGRYVEALVLAQRYPEAMKVADECIRSGKSNDMVLAKYTAAYIVSTGSDKGFQERLSAAKGAAGQEAASKVKESMVDLPAPDFSLVGLDGKKVTLSKLRGKVVVVDFWATWCGPCISSFPYLQKVYDKYKSDPQVVILALNTWERVPPQDREKTVRKFIADNKYTFPVLFDEKIVEQYKVEGIPTKFIIDQKGRIRFKDIGFGGGEEMMAKMDEQFRILLKN